MLALKVITTVVLALVLLVLVMASAAVKDDKDTSTAVRPIMLLCTLAQILAIIVIWIAR